MAPANTSAMKLDAQKAKEWGWSQLLKQRKNVELNKINKKESGVNRKVYSSSAIMKQMESSLTCNLKGHLIALEQKEATALKRCRLQKAEV